MKQSQFEKDMASPYRPLFEQVRTLLLSFPEIEETIKERITTYSDNMGGICHMRTVKNGVDIGFLKGAKINDHFGFLTGNTKRMRVLNIPADAPQDESVLRYYIEESIRLNR